MRRAKKETAKKDLLINFQLIIQIAITVTTAVSLVAFQVADKA